MDVKESRDSVLQEIRRENADKPGKELGLVQNELHYFDGVDEDSFWPLTVDLIEEFITGEIDENRYQDVIRHYYLKKGWKLYTVLELLKTLCRQALVCNSPDPKEKTGELIARFMESRLSEETSYKSEIGARRYAEKCVKDGELFVICWVS